MAEKNNGLTIVYTGSGQGKTSAALGLALRATAAGQKVIMLQFIKSQSESGEQKIKKLKPGFVIKSLGLGFVGISNDRRPRSEHCQAAQQAIQKAKKYLKRCDVLILDELNNALHNKLIKLTDVLAIIRARPRRVTLVLTGRYAHPRIISAADLVTEMKEVRHPFKKGRLAQPELGC